MKEILIITSYFPPETGAASNRIFHLAKGIQNGGYKVSVITPLPNYPTGKIFNEYKGKIKQTSRESKLVVHRLWIYSSNSKNKFLRLISMLSYSVSLVWYFLCNKIPATVIVQSPPLFVSFTCMLILKSKKRKIILNVSDLWPLAGFELGIFKKNVSYKLLERIERFNYKRADLVLGQSDEILTHVSSMFPEKETLLYRNYPDFEMPQVISHSSSNRLTLVYAGLLGVAQGIYRLCQKLDYNDIEFHIYGAGVEQEKIESFILDNPDLPIIYHGEIPRTNLHHELLKYDLSIIPLIKRIYGSVPSKIFEYAKLGLPILYFGGGEGAEIVKNHKLGWVVEVGNYEELNTILSDITHHRINSTLKNNIKMSSLAFNFDVQLEKLLKHF